MKVWCLAFLATISAAAADFKAEIQQAFLAFDANSDEVVTKTEIMQAVMTDLYKGRFSQEEKQQILDAIEVMGAEHDKDQDGLDFLELYLASGGLLREL